MTRGALALAAALAVGSGSDAAAQTVPVAPPGLDPAARILVPRAVAPGGAIVASSRGLKLPITLQSRSRSGKWRTLGGRRTRRGAVVVRARLRARALRLRARGADGRYSPSRRIRVRRLRLAAVGDINFGNGPGRQIARFGPAYPWTSVGPTLRRADIAFGNLECAVSTRGRAQDKKYVFRGHPAAVRAMRRVAGMDVVNLANNHAGDYGDVALLDTLATLRRNGVVAVGAGRTERSAYAPRYVERLGLKVAFVGFSEVLPFEFQARGRNPGTAWAYPARIRSGVRRAARNADVVIATFHWGIERDGHESARQRQLANLALASGATAVIGAHPHVLQPVRKRGRKLVAFSLGNFVFSAGSPGTQRTGILQLGLGRARVLKTAFRRATIRNSRPVLNRR